MVLKKNISTKPSCSRTFRYSRKMSSESSTNNQELFPMNKFRTSQRWMNLRQTSELFEIAFQYRKPRHAYTPAEFLNDLSPNAWQNPNAVKGVDPSSKITYTMIEKWTNREGLLNDLLYHPRNNIPWMSKKLIMTWLVCLFGFLRWYNIRTPHMVSLIRTRQYMFDEEIYIETIRERF